MTHQQLRIARTLLLLQQEVLADKAGIGITTLRLFENGNKVGQEIIDRLREVVEAEGAVLVAPGTVVGGVTTDGGVLLRWFDDLPSDTTERLKAFNRTSGDAAKASKATGVGRRARVPLDDELRKKFRERRAGTSTREGKKGGPQPT